MKFPLFLWIGLLAVVFGSKGNVLFAQSADGSLALPGAAHTAGIGHILSVSGEAANPAMLAFCGRGEAEMSYIDRFGLRELSTLSASTAYAFRPFTAAVHYSYYGMRAYHEQRISLSAARRLHRHWALGLRVHCHLLHYSEEEPDKTALTADVGLRVQASERVSLGFLLQNPLQGGVRLGASQEEERLPFSFSMGAAWQALAPLTLLCEAEKTEHHPIACRAAAEYAPFSCLVLRAGVQSQPFSPGFGLGLRWNFVRLDVGFSHTSPLGFRSACGLKFLF